MGVKDTEFEIYHGDTLINAWDFLRETNPAKKQQFDAVVANPPFSYRWEVGDAISEDMRFKNHGVAPKSATDFAFLLHGPYYLKDDGVMAIILPHGVLFRGGAEERIRRKLLEDGHIATVTGLPANLFYSTGIPVCILVLKKCKKPDLAEERTAPGCGIEGISQQAAHPPVFGYDPVLAPIQPHCGSITMTTEPPALIEHHVDIATADGVSDSYFVHPAGGRHPAMLMWTDIMGLRLAFKGLARRLAADGYAVLAPNPFYRSSKAPALPEGSRLNDDTRKVVAPMMQALNAETHVTDARACIAWLDTQQSVDTGRRMGTMGYCMGGPIALRTAATRADRVGAVATFHGSRMVTDQPDSPHLLFDKLQAACLFAIAENDDQREPNAKHHLRAAAAQAGVSAGIEVYPAMHGWCAPDSLAHNPEQAERAWARMLALFKEALV